ncbi:peroxiredoxin [Intrasporangium chromatireducens Q5-1]|uniref:Peroxiredoxin n=1 Tax=Intrasporangium chromatireducens Q5-1 TaxID=584657 RepID=W9GHH7_9MICO|nr:OsmC family peroxiredoxin [Intrasporangium chromatireducens]EWT05686.1 peroxiredoxin [Intrasporangium chromatireducens Q5-1]
MATTRTASAHWEGTLFEGSGTARLETSGAGQFDVSWAARAEQAGGKTSPEELIAAAHATCYAMQLSNMLAQAGHPAESLDTTASVDFAPPSITGITLTVKGNVPGMSAEDFKKTAEEAKEQCPVSKALQAVPIKLEVQS